MKKNANILVVEDDPGIQDMLKYSLSAEGYTLQSAYTVKEAWAKIEDAAGNTAAIHKTAVEKTAVDKTAIDKTAVNKTIDLVLLDWMLPDSSGIDLLNRIRKYHSMLPVIMVTAKSEEEDRILGLDVGADDYVTKPFSIRELSARIQALLRRTMPDEQALQIGELFLDPVSHRVKVAQTTLALSPTEFRLLHYFMSHTDRVFSRTQLLDQVWGAQVFVEERTVDVHIRRLRKQLQPFALDKLLQTVHGNGYRFSKQK